jgi:hypothetical protein
VVPVTRHHQDKIVRIADEFPIALSVSSAFGSLAAGAHLFMPLPVEMIVQRRQGYIGEQRGKYTAL